MHRLAGEGAVLALLFAGCVGSNTDRLAPETRFRPVSACSELAGVFHNQGRSRSGEWKPLLSEYVFPQVRFAAPPDEIRFSAPDPARLRCDAVRNGTVLATRDLTEGKDFRFDNGCLRLAGVLDQAGVMEAGIGVSTAVSRLGLIDNGDLFLRCRGGGAGLMLFVVPLAVTEHVEAVFERVRVVAPPSP